MGHTQGSGGRIKHTQITNYSILLIYCKTNKDLKFLDFTTTTNIRNYKYLIMKKKLADERFKNLIIIKSIKDNFFNTQKKMNEIASKFNIKTNIFDDAMIDNMKSQLNKNPSETSEEDEKEIKEIIDKEKDILYNCDCGSKFKKSNLRHHLNTDKHKNFINKPNSNQEFNIDIIVENNNDNTTDLKVIGLNCIECKA